MSQVVVAVPLAFMASWFQTFGDRALILGRRPRLRLALQLLAFAVLTGSLVYAVRDSWSDAEELCGRPIR